MYLAMNRFRIFKKYEEQFVQIWKNRKSRLNEMDGYIEFFLLKGPANEDTILFSSHTSWKSKEHFDAWVGSEQFRESHAQKRPDPEMFAAPNALECFESVLSSHDQIH